MNIVFGRNGQVARCLHDALEQSGQLHEWKFVGSDECDFSLPSNVEAFLNALPFAPKVVVNAAAFTAVDLAETERERAFNINAVSVGKIAHYCAKNDITLFHYSTDYIFDGKGTKPFQVNDTPRPVNYYGYSKLEGEVLITQSNCKHFILRVSWVYSQYGKNFVKTMLNLMEAKKIFSVVNDQIGSPTSAIDVAHITLEMLGGGYAFGVYHFTGTGRCSWHDFATEIWHQAKMAGSPVALEEIKAIPTTQYPTPAQRPLNSQLELGVLKAKATPWQDSLSKVISLLKKSYRS